MRTLKSSIIKCKSFVSTNVPLGKAIITVISLRSPPQVNVRMLPNAASMRTRMLLTLVTLNCSQPTLSGSDWLLTSPSSTTKS